AVCTEDDWPKIEPWFDAIYSRVMSFPASVDELVGSLSNPARHLRLLRESRKDFWQNFQPAFKTRTSPSNATPNPSRPTDSNGIAKGSRPLPAGGIYPLKPQIKFIPLDKPARAY
ncbi:hypothetical protein KXX12_008818, partial [Aspergillus fumigatus]